MVENTKKTQFKFSKSNQYVPKWPPAVESVANGIGYFFKKKTVEIRSQMFENTKKNSISMKFQNGRDPPTSDGKRRGDENFSFFLFFFLNKNSKKIKKSRQQQKKCRKPTRPGTSSMDQCQVRHLSFLSRSCQVLSSYFLSNFKDWTLSALFHYPPL